VLSLATFLQDNLFLIRPPGEFASYDTYGITLAGHLIEQASALPYDVAVRQRLFARIGMSRSSIGVVPAAASSDAAVGYRVAGGAHRPEAWEHYRSAPASSANSTANDMAAFMLTVLGEGATPAGGRAWSEKLGRQLQQPQYQNGPEGGFAYGFWDETRDGVRGIFHGGIMNGYTTQMYLVPEREFGFFLAYNRDGAPTSRLRDDLTAAMLRGLGSAPAASSAAPPPALTIAVEEFAGTYADATYCHTCYENESEGGMSPFPVQVSGPGRLEFSGGTWVAVAPLEFVNEKNGRRAWFKRSEDGRISHFTISHRTYEKLTERLLANVAAASGVPVDRHPFAPRVYRLTQQHARAAEAYGRLAQIRPWDGVLHHYHGQTLLTAGNAAAAIAALERAAAAEQWPSPTWYMLATAQAAQKNGPAALDALERALASGFRDARRLRQDRAFESVRSDPRFAKIVESLGGK
jgi:hypothetical protein